MIEAHRPIDVKLRELCDQLKGTRTTINFADIEPLLREAADFIEDEMLFIRAMEHAIQSSWRAMPADIAQHFANDETIDTQNRLPSAVAWMSAMLKE